MNQQKILVAASATALAAFLGVSAYFAVAPRGSDCSGSAVAGATLGGPFTLIDGSGATVTDTQLIDRPTLIYFGFTFCPDVCPLDNARNAEAVALLSEQGIAAKAAFISVDPARDTSEIVGIYASNFGADMVGLTGSPEQVDAAARAYRVYYKAQETGDDYYLVDHTTFTYLAMPGAGVVDFFRPTDTPEMVAERASCFAGAN